VFWRASKGRRKEKYLKRDGGKREGWRGFTERNIGKGGKKKKSKVMHPQRKQAGGK